MKKNFFTRNRNKIFLILTLIVAFFTFSGYSFGAACYDAEQRYPLGGSCEGGCTPISGCIAVQKGTWGVPYGTLPGDRGYRDRGYEAPDEAEPDRPGERISPEKPDEKDVNMDTKQGQVSPSGGIGSAGSSSDGCP